LIEPTIQPAGGGQYFAFVKDERRVLHSWRRMEYLPRASTSAPGLVSRVLPVHTAVRNYTRDEGGPFEVGNQVLISSHRKLLSSKAMVVTPDEQVGQRWD